MATTNHMYRYWGKAGKGDDSSLHLLVYHCLDVAACGVMLLRLAPRWRLLLGRLTGLPNKSLESTILVYLAAHDLGKFATGFQNLRPDLLRRLQHRSSDKGYIERHDSLGYLLWRDGLRRRIIPTAQRRRRGTNHPQVDVWMRSVTGHHGEPPQEKQRLLRDAFVDSDIDAAADFLDALVALAGLPAFPLPPADGAATASWWVAGLAVLADWLGSNTEFFPFQAQVVTLDEYWETAMVRAKRAVLATGLHSALPSPHLELRDCFAAVPQNFHPSPLQEWAQKAEITHGPTLFILEEVTGAGKTEAALLLAWRLLHAHGNCGIYFGLPTMATANGMYQRLATGSPPVYARLFDTGQPPSLVLAHGKATLVDAFRQAVLPASTDESDYGDGTAPAGARCNAWLADSRKKALLAEVGVGTVDQALLGVLPSRHQSLRLLGLLGKVLIVDEVHACDAYMNRLLEHLLRAHAHAGGSAILLSATLPSDQKRRLTAAFAEGAGWNAEIETDSFDYPLATRLNEHGIAEIPLATRPEAARRVNVRFVDDEGAAITVLEEATTQGQCACWICNTVDDARQRYERLRSAHPDWPIALFHARFTLHDRLRIERDVLRLFGKNSGPGERRGRILIATQVVEQSLDLDFDVLISDLAPIDLLIQRAGRLRRHPRDKEGRRIDGPDQRGTPLLTLLAPPWSETPPSRWLNHFLPGTAAVYEGEDGRLWLAMKLLRELGGFVMPDHARKLVEEVYGADPFDDIPEGLQRAALDAEGLASGRRSLAELKALHLADGYRREGAWLDDDRAPTRLGEPTTTLWLARWQAGKLLPLHNDTADDPHTWQMSSLTVRESLIAREIVPDGLDPAAWEEEKRRLPAKGKWGVTMALTPTDDGWRGSALDLRQEKRTWHYSPLTGLAVEP